MPDSHDEAMRNEFNLWAADGRGQGMERQHDSIATQTIAAMRLQPGERVLDLGCGIGWATRRMARLVQGAAPERPREFGQAVGIDISDEMIRQARELSAEVENALFVWGSAHEIPWQEDYFHKALSIEAFYYCHDQPQVLGELRRVLAPRGELYILINLYRDNPYSLRWVEHLQVPVAIHSADEYTEMLRQAGFAKAAWQHVSDLSPTPESYTGRWFANADELREYKRIGALLLSARKPDKTSPPRAVESC
jgi:SAM-dependent methyltransferase